MCTGYWVNWREGGGWYQWIWLKSAFDRKWVEFLNKIKVKFWVASKVCGKIFPDGGGIKFTWNKNKYLVAVCHWLDPWQDTVTSMTGYWDMSSQHRPPAASWYLPIYLVLRQTTSKDDLAIQIIQSHWVLTLFSIFKQFDCLYNLIEYILGASVSAEMELSQSNSNLIRFRT